MRIPKPLKNVKPYKFIIHICDTKPKLKELIKQLEAASKVVGLVGGLDLETTTFDYWRPETKVMTMGICVDDVHCWGIPLEHKNSPWKGQSKKLLKLIQPYIQKSILWAGNNYKFDQKYMIAKYNMPANFGPDNMLISYANDENIPHGLKFQAEYWCKSGKYDAAITWPKHDPVIHDINDVVAKYDELDLKTLLKYNALDAFYSKHVYTHEAGILRQDIRSARIYKHLLEKGSKVFTEIEMQGMWIDKKRLVTATEICVKEVVLAKDKLDEMIPDGWQERNLNTKQQKQGFNWGSYKQLGCLLFQEDGFKFPILQYTDAGAASTAESVLIELGAQYDHPIFTLIGTYRKWVKYLNTYLKPWAAKLDKNDRLHPTFNLNGTVTGRLSGKEGVHQVPRDKFIRGIIGAPPGWSFFEIDGCFVGGTLVETVEGPKRIDQIKPGELVFSYKNKRVLIGTVTGASCTGIKPTIRITHSGGLVFECTLDHQILVQRREKRTGRGGSTSFQTILIEAKDLIQGDRLTPFRQIHLKTELYTYSNGGSYHKLKVSRAVAEHVLGDIGNSVVHHQDRNKNNNSIDNLSVMSRAHHSKMHSIENYQKQNHTLRIENLRRAKRGQEKIPRDKKPHPNVHHSLPNVEMIEFTHTIKPVYAITVEGEHNYALSCGVFVGNSQIELRVAAAISNERTMLKVYRNKGDIHRSTAAAAAGIPESEVTSDQRKKAKSLNFGFLYGMGWKKFKEYSWEKYDIRLTDGEAKRFRKRFFDLYRDLPEWHNRVRRVVKVTKYVVSPIGRKRRLPDVSSHDDGKRAAAEREAINSPVQGLGSDIVLAGFIEMILEVAPKIDPNWRDYIRPVGMVHDAQYYEVRNDVIEYWVGIVKKNFDDHRRLKRWFGYTVPLNIPGDIKIGTHWGDAVDWNLGDPLPFTPR